MIQYADTAPAESPAYDARNIELSDKQSEAWHAFDLLPQYGEMLYGGGKGGGKTWFGCLKVYAECRRIIDQFKLPRQEYPIPVACMVRQRGVDFTDTVLATWKQLIPPDKYELHVGNREIIIEGRVQIDYGGLDDQASLSKFQGSEYEIIWIDQGEECSLDAVAALRGSRRRKINDQRLHYRSLFTCNPANCWLKDEFVDRLDPGNVFKPALWRDNPHLPPGYAESLRRAYRHRPELLAAMLEGRWDVFASANCCIRGDWVLDAIGRDIVNAGSRRRVLAVDVAREGDDETVVYGLLGTTPIRRQVWGKKETMYTANRVAVEARQFGAEIIVIDANAIGAGPADRLVEMGFDVLCTMTGAGATDPSRFVNLRAEIWDHAGKMFEAGDVAWMEDDEQLRRELCWPEYRFKAGGRMLIESKEELKSPKRMGKSPDYADSYVLGLAGLAWLEKSGFRKGDVLRFREGTKAAKVTEALSPLSYDYGRRQLDRERAGAKRW